MDLRPSLGQGEKKSAQAQYQTMSLDDIKALPVGNLIAPGGVCIMWCTWPLVAIGAHVEVIRGWGLLPVTGGGWTKRYPSGKARWGTGYVARSLHEPYIIARLPGSTWKGAGFPNLVETLEADAIDGIARSIPASPTSSTRPLRRRGRRRGVSVFSRQSRAGWDTWGNEATKFDATEAGG